MDCSTVLGLFGACCQPRRLFLFLFFNWAFCPWGVFSSIKSKGQMATWSDALPSKAGSQGSSTRPCQGRPSLQENCGQGGGHSPGHRHSGASRLPPFSLVGASQTLGSRVLFPSLRGGPASLHWMDEHQCPALPIA